MQSPFHFNDYKACLAKNLEERGSLSRLSERVNLHRSHISRVLSTEVQLTPDQALAVCEFFGFNESETEFFMAQVDLERAATQSLKRRLQNKLSRLKTQFEDLSHRLQKPSINSGEQQIYYYSSWLWSAIHIAVSIDKLQTASQLAERFHVPTETVTSILRQLESFSLVRRRNNRWEFSSTTMHLPKSSPFISMHHSNWRERASLDARNPGTDGVHYTVVQSLSLRDYEEIKSLLLKFIDRYHQIAGPSREEELVTFTCDFFKS